MVFFIMFKNELTSLSEKHTMYIYAYGYIRM